MSRVEVEGLVKRYGETAALDGVSITFENGEFFGLLGPSGSGKTTLLRAVAGFVDLDAGSIRFDGARVDSVPVHRRDIGMVFQNYALFPHMSVAENIAFGLDVRAVGRAEIEARVMAAQALVRLQGFEARKPRQLSGGQQQRVALARALVTRPRVLLLDEPLGALDRRLRQEMQVELKEIQRETGVTSIFVTHDQEEALTLSDRIAIIDHGRLVQVGPPAAVYERPANVFAAQFLGDANVFRGAPAPEGLKLADGTLVRMARPSAAAIVRPEKVEIRPAGAPAPHANAIAGTVQQAVYSGASVTYRLKVAAFGETPFLAFTRNRDGSLFEAGTAVVASWPPGQTVPVEP